MKVSKTELKMIVSRSGYIKPVSAVITYNTDINSMIELPIVGTSVTDNYFRLITTLEGSFGLNKETGHFHYDQIKSIKLDSINCRERLIIEMKGKSRLFLIYKDNESIKNYLEA